MNDPAVAYCLLAVALGVPLLFGWAMTRPGRGLSSARSRFVIVVQYVVKLDQAALERIDGAVLAVNGLADAIRNLTVKADPAILARADQLIAVLQDGGMTPDEVNQENTELGAIADRLESIAKPT